jgi:hypothetical protein
LRNNEKELTCGIEKLSVMGDSTKRRCARERESVEAMLARSKRAGGRKRNSVGRRYIG